MKWLARIFISLVFLLVVSAPAYAAGQSAADPGFIGAGKKIMIPLPVASDFPQWKAAENPYVGIVIERYQPIAINSNHDADYTVKTIVNGKNKWFVPATQASGSNYEIKWDHTQTKYTVLGSKAELDAASVANNLTAGNFKYKFVAYHVFRMSDGTYRQSEGKVIYYTVNNSIGVGDPSESNSAISPTTASFDKYSENPDCRDITVELTLNGNTFCGVKNGSVDLALNNAYTISPDTTAVTILKSYLDDMPTGDTTLTFKFSSGNDQMLTVTVSDSTSAPPDDGGGGGGNGDRSPSTPPQTYNVDVSGGGTVPVTVNTVTGSVSLDLGTLAGNLSDGGNTVVTVPSIPGANSFTANLPSSSLSVSGQGSLTLDTSLGSLTIPGDMLSGTGFSGNAGITVSEGSKDNLPDDVKEALGERPIIQLILSVNGQQTDWYNPAAPVTVSIPYTPTAAELTRPESIVIWYIDGSGNAVSVPNGHYDPVTGTVTFGTAHFSDYAVAYNPVRFDDVPANAWYSKAVGFISARDITKGTGGGNFSPGAKLTRGEFIVMLMKAYELAPDTNPADNFSDAGNTYYSGYISAAKRLGITAGTGNNMYAPGKEITRQEMFTLLYNALKAIGQLPQGEKLPDGSSGRSLSDFRDSEQVCPWAVDAMTLFVETGNAGGSNGALAPLSTTSRAEMAQVLYNLLGKI